MKTLKELQKDFIGTQSISMREQAGSIKQMKEKLASNVEKISAVHEGESTAAGNAHENTIAQLEKLLEQWKAGKPTLLRWKKYQQESRRLIEQLK